MDGIAARAEGGRHQGRDVEITPRRGGRADADRAVGQARVRGLAIGGREHRHRLQAQLTAGPDDANRDLATVGDEDTLHGAGSITRSVDPNSTSVAFSTQISATRPRHPALMEFISFMTSRMQTVSSSSTMLPTSTNGGCPGAGARYDVPTIGALISTPCARSVDARGDAGRALSRVDVALEEPVVPVVARAGVGSTVGDAPGAPWRRTTSLKSPSSRWTSSRAELSMIFRMF